MGRKRVCGRRCHDARGTKCRCCCQAFYHGSAGAANRQALQDALDPEELLRQHGFTKGETAYIEQKKIPEPVNVH